MVKVVRMTAVGGPEVLRTDDLPLAPPKPGEVRVRHAAIGVNFVDIYFRKGIYPAGPFPAPLGVEAAGMVEAVGDGVTGFRPGDRVAYAGLPPGSYAEARNLPAERLLTLPADLSFRQAAAALLRGLTAHLLLFRVFGVKPGQTMLIHAAAGGVGLFLTRWAKRLGAITIGTVGSAAKADLARSAGLDHPILYRQEDFADAVRRLTGGRGVDFAVDGIGDATLAKTLSVLRPFGLAASIGQAGGPVPAIGIDALRNVALTRPSILGDIADLDAYREGARAVFAVLADGLAVEIGAEFPLAEAARAQAEMEAGRTTGSIILTAP